MKIIIPENFKAKHLKLIVKRVFKKSYKLDSAKKGWSYLFKFVGIYAIIKLYLIIVSIK